MDKADNIEVKRGRISYFFHNEPAKDHILDSIRLTGKFYEDDLLDWILSLNLGSGFVIDAGAFIGNHSIFFAAVLNRKTISFEVNPASFAILERNIKLNNLENKVAAFNLALGESASNADFIEKNEGNEGSFRIKKSEEGEFKVVDIDQKLKAQKGQVSLIKIDVEGFELEVLKGAKKRIQKDKPLLIVECINEEDFNETALWLKDLSYIPVSVFCATPTFAFCHIEEAERVFWGKQPNFQEEYKRYRENRRLSSTLNKEYQLLGNIEKRLKIHEKRVINFQEKSLEDSKVIEDSFNLFKSQLEMNQKGLNSLIQENLEALEKNFLLETNNKLQSLKEFGSGEINSSIELLHEKIRNELKSFEVEFLTKISAKQSDELNAIKDSFESAFNRQIQGYENANKTFKKSIKDVEEITSHISDLVEKSSESIQQKLSSTFKGIEDKLIDILNQEGLEKGQREILEQLLTLKDNQESHNEVLNQLLKLNELQNKYEKLLNDISEEKILREVEQRESQERYLKLLAEFNELKIDFNNQVSDTNYLTSYLEEAEKEIVSLKFRLKEKNLHYDDIRDSKSYQIGRAIALAIKDPGKNTLLLPWRIMAAGKNTEPLLSQHFPKSVLKESEKELAKKPSLKGQADSLKLNNNKVEHSQLRDEEIKTNQVQHENFEIRGFSSPFAISSLKKLKVACILDDFSWNSFSPECDFLQLCPDDSIETLKRFKPNLLFIESAWRGKDQLWTNRINYMTEDVLEILNFCKDNRIPTAFWNKEDPVHFETFINSASHFDFVFTTDLDCVSQYKKILKHDRVYFLPFACQPEIHNPIEKFERLDRFCFAGAYYKRYKERSEDLETIVDTVSKKPGIDIYDRNFGKNDENYMFPERFQNHILGTLAYEEIEKAYKGYKYGINLNSIKQSQTMFARRVYELAACNTLVLSNYSNGLRKLFGDLVISSDSRSELNDRLNSFLSDDQKYRKFILLGLRKVLSEHCYEDRMIYVANRCLNLGLKADFPTIKVLSFVRNQNELRRSLENFKRQSYEKKELLIILEDNFYPNEENSGFEFSYLTRLDFDRKDLSVTLGKNFFFAGFSPSDYYGANYLTDQVLALRYSNSDLVGKASFYQRGPKGLELSGNKDKRYCESSAFSLNRAIFNLNVLESFTQKEFLEYLVCSKEVSRNGFSIDEFNYLASWTGDESELENVKDLDLSFVGSELSTLQSMGELVAAKDDSEELKFFGAKFISENINFGDGANVEFELETNLLKVKSNLADGKHEYFYGRELFKPEDFGFSQNNSFYLEQTPGLDIRVVMICFDAKGQRLNTLIALANRNQNFEVPENTASIKWGLRVLGAGQCTIKKLYLEKLNDFSGIVIKKSPVLVLTNQYPEYSNLYRNAFLHRRVLSYKDSGVNADVFRFNSNYVNYDYEFENIDVYSGYKDRLRDHLSAGNYKTILVHFLDSEMWEILEPYLSSTKIIVWIHGADIQPWFRRAFNIETEKQKKVAIEKSNQRTEFWRALFSSYNPRLHFVFVSTFFAKQVFEDIGVELHPSQYDIIHNFIDTDKFDFIEKKASLRKNILSIRPFASKTYANDLTVKAILSLKKEKFFKDLKFTIIGDGPLFDSTTSEIAQLKNVELRKQFLNQDEISKIHKENGVFLCPSRMDTQGVSRDEAMSSGLVPVTNKVAAIPEFVDENCGFLAKEEDHEALAVALKELYSKPELFLEMSQNAGKRVRSQSSRLNTIDRELEIIMK